MSDRVVIDKITLHLSNSQSFNVKEVETILIMRDFIEIYNFSIVDSLDATRSVNLIMKHLDIDPIEFQEVVDFVVNNYDMIKTMKDSKLIDFAEKNYGK